MKKTNIFLMTMIFCLAICLPAMAAYSYDVKIVVNGAAIDFPDQKPYIDSDTGRTMVPIRFIAEALGASVGWEPDTQTATIDRTGQNIRMQIGSAAPTVNGDAKVLDAPAKIDGSRTMVPLRFISEVLGATVDWNSGTRTVNINDSKNNQNPDVKYIGLQEVPGEPGYKIATYEAKKLPLLISNGTTILKIEKGSYANKEAVILTVDKKDNNNAPSLIFNNKRLNAVRDATTNSNWVSVGNQYKAYYFLKSISGTPYLDIDPSQAEKLGIWASGALYWLPNPIKSN